MGALADMDDGGIAIESDVTSGKQKRYLCDPKLSLELLGALKSNKILLNKSPSAHIDPHVYLGSLQSCLAKHDLEHWIIDTLGLLSY